MYAIHETKVSLLIWDYTLISFGLEGHTVHTRLSHYSSHSITLNKERKSYISMSLSLHMLFNTLRNFVVLTYVVGNSPKIKKSPYSLHIPKLPKLPSRLFLLLSQWQLKIAQLIQMEILIWLLQALTLRSNFPFRFPSLTE